MTFKYFAFGSNMLSERMRINCPSAVKQCVAVLKDYQLTFTGYANTWKGSPATVIEKPGSKVWGVVWEISKRHEESLDRQEFTYQPVMVTVETAEKEQLQCKLYQKSVPLSEKDAKPSAVYKSVILKGAMEHELPKEYIEQIQNLEDNGYKGPVEIPINNPLQKDS